MFLDVLTIERRSASMGMIMLWKRQTEGATLVFILRCTKKESVL